MTTKNDDTNVTPLQAIANALNSIDNSPLAELKQYGKWEATENNLNFAAKDVDKAKIVLQILINVTNKPADTREGFRVPIERGDGRPDIHKLNKARIIQIKPEHKVMTLLAGTVNETWKPQKNTSEQKNTAEQTNENTNSVRPRR